ncbi:helix-turn-helix domain-containing protein [Thiohalobacter thiocyanaticus]|uniref:Helix-turn-helix domain-containing protein n=1 Tax=Thiohalobacter thiocyanaticus TaxID=585455 RepID=A0A426QH49_9GAMM|nr:helix-turn-helix domain-containing protein [Thiohalobacter thiocyanaticus]RRQ21088.1 helix-turn-helix domain-containing protein [Thiohalobacter thiocyanaticus]
MTETPESTESEPTATTADTAGVGARLREVREHKGISPAEVAAQLHLNEQTIVALEQDDRSRLPAPIYVRGYVRAYARLLGLDEEELLARYQPAESPELRTVGMPPQAQPALRSARMPWRLLGTLVLLVALAGLAVFVLPGLWERFTTAGDPEASTAGEVSDLEPLPVPSGSPRSEAGDSRVRLPALTAPSDPRPAPGTPGRPESMPEPPPVPEPPPASESPPVAESPPAASAPVAPARPEVPPAPAEAGPQQLQLRLQLSQDSWISIRNAAGERLLVGLYQAGSEHRISGRPPLQVVLGNAAGVELTVDGEPYSLSGYDPGSVARFTLE